MPVIRFNSKLVRLKALGATEKALGFGNRFNSKLVRLKGESGARDEVSVFVFQFQTGAIKRLATSAVTIRNWPGFQFQTGAIKRHTYKVKRRRYHRCFNSKLVRLKALVRRRVVVIENLSFNSKLVRLKANNTR